MTIARFLRDQSGTTAIEYGLIGGLVSVVILAALTTIGTSMAAKFQLVVDAL